MNAAVPSAESEDRWERRPRLAFLVRAIVFLAPLVIATDVSLVLGRFLPEPHGVPASIAWWAAVLTASAIALVVFDRLFRRLLPLSVLLNLALVFPGVAPSRYSAAFRAGTIRNLERRIEQAKDEAVDADTAQAAATVVELIAALAVHDPKTRGHSERTRTYSDLIAEELGLPDDDRDRLRWSALLHDIGKLHVPSTLLNKMGRPEPDEWEVLRSHPAEGARITGALRGWLGPWGLAIEQHHEQFDGSGYPYGLAGDEISFGGRIVSVADAYEVMTSARSYSPAVTPAAAREELVRCAGRHFDPEIVRAFLRIAIGRFPKQAGILVGLAQLPGFVGVGQILQQAGSAVAASAAVVSLAVGGVVVPGAPGLGAADSEVAADEDGPATSAGTTRGTTRGTTSSPPPPVAATDAQTPQAPFPFPSTPPPESTTATSGTAPPPPTTAAPATSTPAAPVLTTYYLRGTATGQPPSPAELRRDRPAGSGAPDYDGDDAPGRTLAPSARPATTTDPGEHQLWLRRYPTAVRMMGTPELTIASAVAGFDAGKGSLRGYLFDCGAGGESCIKQPIATASLIEEMWSDGSGGFTDKTLTFTALDHVIAADRTLVLRLGVQNGSNPLLIAYGTSSHQASLTLDIR